MSGCFQMLEPDNTHSPLQVASVIASLTAGGIGPVCRYAAEGMRKLKGWQITLVSLHDPISDAIDPATGVRLVGLGLDGNCARLFLRWLATNPQDLIITSDVSRIEPAYRFIPPTTRHVLQIHDSGRSYREVAVRHAAWVDGVTCVGKHIEGPLRRSLNEAGFKGILRTIHNGANFPPLIQRQPQEGPLRLLFMGRVEAIKGVFDFVPLLQRLKQLNVPVTLNIVGGENMELRRQFKRKGLECMVTWTGRVPHSRCYDFAAESDIFLMPSRKESFGMVTIEAMSMGCLPIAYNIPSGSREIIENGISGLLLPMGDIRAWAEHIRQLHLDRSVLARISASAVDRSRKLFNVDRVTNNLGAFLTDVMTHSDRHPPKRELGMPPETPAIYAQPPRGYQRLPAALREWIRNQVGASPRLSYWLLSR